MLAGLLSLYQLVLSLFVYLYLYQMLAELLYLHQLVLSVFVYVSLSIQRSPELSFYYCLQSSSLSLSNSVTDYHSSLLKASFQFLTHKITVKFIMSTCACQCLIFWVFVAREFVTDRQTTVLLYRIIDNHYNNWKH